MQKAYGLGDAEKRKLAYLYHHSGITNRYSVLGDYSLPESAWTFLRPGEEPVPDLESRMEVYKKEALPLSLKAIKACIGPQFPATAITHLITVSCTGMSAPGLDLEIQEALNLSGDIFRTAVNFMGCYAAIHGLKLAKLICDSEPGAFVLVVATELCTIHFQQHYSMDNASSSLLFGDGSAAVLLSGSSGASPGITLDHFYAKVSGKGKKDMAWELGSKGFLMTLSGYIPQLIEEDIVSLAENALRVNGLKPADITSWCVHPGGRKILDTVQKKLGLSDAGIQQSRDVLKNYGNMSSPTILFVLKEIIEKAKNQQTPAKIFGLAFGPGLTMETFIATIP